MGALPLHPRQKFRRRLFERHALARRGAGKRLAVIGADAEAAVQIEQNFFELVVLLFAVIEGEQFQKIGIARLVRLGEHPVERLRLQALAVGGVLRQHLERAVHAREEEVGADEAGTEGMDGADLRHGQAGELIFEPRALRLARFGRVEPRDEAALYLFAHLRRRLLGEGQGKHALHLRAREYLFEHALDHDEGLAAPRRRGHDDLALRRQDGALFFGIFHCRHAFIFPPFPALRCRRSACR